MIRPVPKKGKKPKTKRKPLANRRHFRAFDNGKRCRRRSDEEVIAWALEKQREKLKDLSPAQLAVGAILKDGGIHFEYEKFWINGDRPIFSDLYVPHHRLTIEVDGRFHRGQSRYDTQRAEWLARTHKVGTIRIWNRDVASGLAKQRIRQMLGLNL